MPANCSAGMCFTPSLEAIQVVPQKKDTSPSATSALVRVPRFLTNDGYSFSSVDIFPGLSL